MALYRHQFSAQYSGRGKLIIFHMFVCSAVQVQRAILHAYMEARLSLTSVESDILMEMVGGSILAPIHCTGRGEFKYYDRRNDNTCACQQVILNFHKEFYGAAEKQFVIT